MAGFWQKIKRQIDPFDNGATWSNPEPQRTPVATAQPSSSTPARMGNPNRSVASKAFDQVNPFDNGRTWSSPIATKAPSSIIDQATHNGITNMAGDALKSAAHLGLAVNQGAANLERKVAGLPTQNADEFMHSSFPSLPHLNDDIGYTGTKRQIIGDTLNTAANVVAPGTAKIVENTAVKALPAVVPKIIPKVVSGIVVGGGLGAPQNVGAYVANTNEPITAKGIVEAAKQGAITGAEFGAGAELAPYAARGAGKVAQATFKKAQSLPRDIRKTATTAAAEASPIESIPVNNLEKTDMQGYGDLDAKQVDHYKTKILNGEPIEPLVVVRDDLGRMFVEDGKHRRQAYADFGIKNAPARITTPDQVNMIAQGGYAAIPGRRSAVADDVVPQAASPENVPQIAADMHPQESPSPVVEHTVEDAAANQAALRSGDLEREIQADLGRAGSNTQSIVNAHAKRAGISQRQALDDVWRVADQSGYDIRDGFPVMKPQDQTPLTPFKTGVETERQAIDALNQATEKLQAGYAKGLTGVNHSVVLKESPYQQQHAYIDQGGNLRTFVTQKRPDGSWQEIVNSHAPIKSQNSEGEIVRLMSDPDIQAEVKRASEDGITRQYIWTENPDTGVTGLKTDGRVDPVTPKTMAFDPQNHTVEGGFVRDKNSGEILGNYVSVGPSGVQVQVGRQFVNLGIEPSKLNDGQGGLVGMGRSEGGNNQFNQAERWIDAVTKDEQTRERLRNLVTHPAREAEAAMKAEANALGNGIKSWRKAFNDTVSPGDRVAAARDAVYVLEPDRRLLRKMTPEQAKTGALQAFADAHGEQAAKVLSSYEQWMRAAYDNLLERMNTVRRHNGLPEISRRDDYITHIQELNNDTGQLYQNMREGIFGEVEGNPTRGKLPAQIAGRTEEFKPIQKYNPYAKNRTGDAKPLDPFTPLARYASVALHNIHLTRPAAMVRSLETGLRAAKEFVDNRPKGLTGPEAEAWDHLAGRFAGNYSDATEWLAEHANILAGKSSNWNRQLLKSEGGRRAITALNFLQRQTGRANVLGNASSVVSQTLNFPSVLGTNKLKATLSGISRSLGDFTDNAAWRKSNFMKERYTDGSVLRDGSTLEKVLKPFGVPLGTVERAFVHIAWNSSYEKALARGLKGDAAIRAADTITSKIVAGRSIGDTAHVYNSALGNVPLQFTREVTEQWKNFTKDQTPYGKALMLVSVFMLNGAVQGVTGRSPLPDPLGTVLDTIKDFSTNDPNNKDNSTAAKLGRAGQRTATTIATAVPLLSSIVNQLPQDTRKTIFGSDSSLGRYDGSLALLGPLQNVIKAGADLAKGKFTSAGQDIVSTLPVGAQARKTWQGVQTLHDGGVKDSQGDIHAEIDHNDPLKALQAVVFGRSALPEVQDYYDGKSSTSGIAALDGPLGKSLTSFKKGQKDQQDHLKHLFSADDNYIRSLSDDERQQLVDAGVIDEDKLTGLDHYELSKRKELGLSAGEHGQTIPSKAEKASTDVQKFYEDRSYVYDGDLQSWQKQNATGSAAKLLATANGIATGRPDLPQTNEVAELYADFNTRRANGKWGAQKENTEKLKFLKAAYKTGLSDQQREWYGLSDANLTAAIDNGEVSKGDMDELVAFDDSLRKAGLTGEIGNTIRKDYGYNTWTSSRSGKKSKAKSFSLPSSYFSTETSAITALNDLLKKASKGGSK